MSGFKLEFLAGSKKTGVKDIQERLEPGKVCQQNHLPGRISIQRKGQKIGQKYNVFGSLGSNHIVVNQLWIADQSGARSLQKEKKIAERQQEVNGKT